MPTGIDEPKEPKEIESPRFVSPEELAEDTGELSLRPKRLREMIGQPKARQNLAGSETIGNESR